jgi:hypothetical protein
MKKRRVIELFGAKIELPVDASSLRGPQNGKGINLSSVTSLK